jgi:predicted nucleotide-binding protein
MILATPKPTAPKGPSPRARQNVILETGMLLSALTRNRMALIVKGHIELPSDLEGIIRLGFNESIREIVPKLCMRLREAVIEVDAGKISHASS